MYNGVFMRRTEREVNKNKIGRERERDEEILIIMLYFVFCARFLKSMLCFLWFRGFYLHMSDANSFVQVVLLN